jgi:transposase
MAKTFRRWSPEQSLLFPPNLQDLVPEGHAARFVLRVVTKELDLWEILESYQEERGYPPHAPQMMTSLLLYGYMRGVYSSRKLSQACEERTDFMMVSGMTKPDHRAIATFRKRHTKAIEGLFNQVVSLCEKAGLVKLSHVAIDGTKIKANASSDKSMSYEDIKKWLEEAERVDAEEDAKFGEGKRGDEFPPMEEALERFRRAKRELEEEDKKKREEREHAEKRGEKPASKAKKRADPSDSTRYNFTDHHSGLMKSRQGFVQGYNAQLAVDADHHVIVACDVSREKNDLGELIPLVDRITRSFGFEPQEVSADTGYCSTENLLAMKVRGIRAYIPKSDKIADRGVVREMSLRLRRAGRRSRYRLRKQVVEPVFGILKSARNFTQFLMRGLQNVRAEWSLLASAHNLWKLKAHV